MARNQYNIYSLNINIYVRGVFFRTFITRIQFYRNRIDNIYLEKAYSHNQNFFRLLQTKYHHQVDILVTILIHRNITSVMLNI